MVARSMAASLDGPRPLIAPLQGAILTDGSLACRWCAKDRQLVGKEVRYDTHPIRPFHRWLFGFSISLFHSRFLHICGYPPFCRLDWACGHPMPFGRDDGNPNLCRSCRRMESELPTWKSNLLRKGVGRPQIGKNRSWAGQRITLPDCKRARSSNSAHGATRWQGRSSRDSNARWCQSMPTRNWRSGTSCCARSTDRSTST